MTRLRSNRILLGSLAIAGVFAALSACSASNAPAPPKNKNGTAGSSGVAGANGVAGSNPSGGYAGDIGGTAGAGTAGAGTAGAGTAGSGTAGAGTAGAGTAGASGGGNTPKPLCTTKVTAASTQIATFENYDGMLMVSGCQSGMTCYSFPFGGATNGTAGVTAGAYSFGDGTATPTLALLAGHTGNYGMVESVTNASGWGEGFGYYFLDASYAPGCVDASAYKGVTMWVRGMVPTGTFSFSVVMSQGVEPDTTTTPVSGGSCTGTSMAGTCASPTKTGIPVSPTWSQVDVLWADLTGGLSGPNMPLAANGDNITGFSFSAGLNFVPESDGSTTYVPVPGDVSIAVDDIAFIP